MSEVDPGQTGAYRRWVMWVVSGIGVAMALYHLWIIGGGPAVEHFAQATGYDPRSGFPWIWTGPPSAIIYRAGHLLFAVALVFLIYPFDARRGQGGLRGEHSQVVAGGPPWVEVLGVEVGAHHAADRLELREGPAVVEGGALAVIEPEHEPHRGRLPGPVGTQEAGHLAVLDGERQVVDRQGGAVALGGAADLDHRCGRLSCT